jgi:outer membrane protein assembly factor BamB
MFARPRPLLAKLPSAIAAVWLLAGALSPALADNLVVRPVPAMVRSGESLALSATTSDGRPVSVQWRLVSGRGAIDPTSGQYTPPIGVQHTEYAVVEASTLDGAYTGSASIEVRQAQIQVSPPVIRVTPSSSVQLTAVLRDGTKPESVIWSVDQEGPHGHVSAGLGLYQAPDAPVPEPIYAKATSGTDPSNLAYATILVVEGVQLRIVPENPSVPVGGTLQLAAKRPDGSDASVEWHLTGPGNISPEGLYSAPNKPPSPDQVVVVEAVSLDPQLPGSGTATITVGPVRVAVDPPQASVGVGSSLGLRATVTGAVDTTVTWTVKDGRGTVAQDGVYTAPRAASAPETATVVAASTVDPSASGACVVSIVPLTVAVSPTSAAVHLGNTLRLTATVTGAVDPSVIWQVTTDGGGSIDSTGLYKAPTAMPPGGQTVKLRAVSRQDPNRWADATVALLPNLTVTVSPPTAIVRVGTQLKLQATVSGGGIVRWSMGQGQEAGFVDPNGTYHAPFAADQMITGVQVTATSVDDSTASATALITVMPHVQVAISGPARVQSGATARYTATVTNFIGNGGVTWNAEGAIVSPLPDGGVQLTAPAVQRSTTIRLTASSAEEPGRSDSKTIVVVVPGGLVELLGDGPDPTHPELVAGDSLRVHVHVTEGVAGLAGGAVHLSASMAGNSRLDLNLGPDAAQPPALGPLLQGAQMRYSNDGVPDSGTIAIVAPPPSGPVDGPGDILEFTVTVASPDAVTQDQECTISVAADGLLGADGQGLGASGSGLSITVHPPGPVARVSDVHAMAGQSLQIPVLLAAWQLPVSNLTMALRVEPMDPVAGGGAGVPSVEGFTVGSLSAGAQVMQAAGLWVILGPIAPGPGVLGTFTVKLPPDALPGARYTVTPAVTGTLDTRRVNVPFRAVPGLLTVWGPGKIDVSLSKPAVHAGQQVVLTATLTGDGREDGRIVWSVPSGIGTVAPTEGPSTVYTAPPQPQNQPVPVVATSVADPTLTGTADVTVAPPVGLNVTLSSPVVPVGGRVTLTAQASGLLPDEDVSVEADMRNDQPGKLVQTGPLTWDYYAPTTMRPGLVRTANVVFSPQPPVGDPVTVPVQIASAAVSVTAQPSTLRPGETALLSAAVSGVTTGAVSWSPAEATPTGQSTAVFTAPARVDAPTTVTITATSQEDVGVSGSTTIQILPQPTIVATGPPDAIPVGATAQLRAEVRYADSADVTWSMLAGPGTVDSKSGVYTATAPMPTPAAATVRATSAHPGLHADVTIRILPLTVALSVDRAQMRAGQFAVLQATVVNGSSTAIQWQVTGPPVGGILEPPPWGAKITYQAHDNISGPAVVTVRVKSTQDPQQYAEVQLVVLPKPQLVIAPTTANAFAGGQPVQFTASLSYISGPVVWSVPKGEAYGTITQDGLYSPPSVRPTGPDTPVAEVVAVCTDAVDNTVQARGSATVRLLAVSVRILTPSQRVRAGQTVQLQAVAVGGLRNTVTWSVQSGPGEIVSPGAYKAPDVVGGPTSVTIRATSDDDPTKYAEVTMPVWPLIAVLVSPSVITVPAGGTAQFAAKVLYADTQAVSWRVAKGPGRIDASQGIYTATIPVTTPAAATVQAVSAEDPSAVGSAQVAIPEVTVSASAERTSLYVGSSVKLNATVQNAADPSVAWEVDGGPSNGTVSPDGIYTAPDTLPNANVTVRAKSRADPTKSGVVLLQTGDAPVVSVAPGEVTMVVGETIQFHASVSNSDDQRVVWSVEGPGTITQDGWFTAAAPPPGGREPIVRATSVRFPWLSGAASVHLAAVSVSVSPPTARVLGGQSVRLTATVTGATDTSVTWRLEGVGTVSQDGTYQAPPIVTPGTQVRVIATSQADSTKWAAATITLGPIIVTVSPAEAEMGLGERVKFAATVTDSNQSVQWSVDGPGQISQDGVYSAPSSASGAATATVRATSVADPSVSGTATVHLKTVSVTVTPATARLLVGDSVKLAALVDGALDQSVSWSTDGPGAVAADGTYSAPDALADQAQVTVTAISHADPTKSASAVITVVPVLVSISPTDASVGLGGQVAFTATVSGPADTSVAWDVAGPGSVKDGVYQAPDVLQTPATAVVSATSVAKPSVRAVANVTIPAVSVSIIGPGHDIQAGSQTQLLARVADARNTSVTWSLLAGRGQVSQAGVYSAPADAASGETATVRATSVADPTKHADLVVSIAQRSISISPAEATVPLGGSQQFAATVAGTADSSVAWSLAGPGSLENGLYRAPSAGSTPAEATVTATSASAPSLSATARIRIPAVLVAIQPPSAKAAAGGSPVRFAASVTNAADTRVAWSLSGPGTLDDTGLYTPPSDVPQAISATVTAASVADPGKFATAVVTVSPAGLPEGAPWPMFRHDAQHTGLSGTIGPADPVAKWTVPLPTSLSSPAVGADGTLYIGTTDRSLVAVDARGELKWTLADTGGSQGWMRSSPAVAADGAIYAVDPDGALVAVSPDGAVRWRVPLTPAGQTAGYSSPAIGADGTVYVAGVRDLYALSRTGEGRWQVTLGAVTTSSPAVGRDGTIYIGCDDGALYAVSPDGNVRWRFHTSAPIRSAPAIGQDGTIYVGSWDMQAYAVSPDGRRKWAVSIGGDSIGSPAIGPDGTIYFPSGDGSLYAVSPGGDVKWRFQTGGPIIASPLVDAAGTIYVAGGDKTLYAVRPDGTQRWAYRAAGVLSGSPVMGGPGLIYLPSEEGLIHVLATAGDVDGDGRVTVADAAVALRLALGIIAPRKGQVAVADLAPPGDPRGDGKITTQDVTLILKRALGLDVAS